LRATVTTLDSALPPTLNLVIPQDRTTVQDVRDQLKSLGVQRRGGRVNKTYNLVVPYGVTINSREKFSAQIQLNGQTKNVGGTFVHMEVAEAAFKFAVHFIEYMEKMQRDIEFGALKDYVKDELSKVFP
jgi:hypothetical protein